MARRPGAARLPPASRRGPPPSTLAGPPIPSSPPRPTSPSHAPASSAPAMAARRGARPGLAPPGALPSPRPGGVPDRPLPPALGARPWHPLPRRPRAAPALPQRVASRPRSPAVVAPPSPWRLGPAHPVRRPPRRGSLPGAACSPARPRRDLGGVRAALAPGVASAVRAEPRRDPCTHGVPGELAAPAARGCGARPSILGSPAPAQRGPGSRGRGAPA
jgi:hypothetical protein